MVTEKKIEPFKKCACGRVYQTREDWEKLPDSKIYESPDGALVEQRQCGCESHITAALVPALTVEELRRAMRVIDSMDESFNQEHTAPELLRLVKVCWMGEWDLTPDEWSGQQVGAALNEGRIPRFEETAGGFHALGVTDCFCRSCREKRAKGSTL